MYSGGKVGGEGEVRDGVVEVGLETVCVSKVSGCLFVCPAAHWYLDRGYDVRSRNTRRQLAVFRRGLYTWGAGCLRMGSWLVSNAFMTHIPIISQFGLCTKALLL